MITCSLAESIDIQGGPKEWSHKLMSAILSNLNPNLVINNPTTG